MKDFYMNITSQNNSYDYSYITSNYNDYSNNTSPSVYNDNIQLIYFVVTCITISIGLPLTLVAIYALYCQVQKDHVAPIYVINLLISDLIQFCCWILQVAATGYFVTVVIFVIIYHYCLMASVCFMVCIALERYLVVAHPLWYRFRQTIKISVVVCVLVWVLPLVFGIIHIFSFSFGITFGVFFLLPLPLFIFFLGGTLKALSDSRVPSDEKRRIVGVLVLVLLIYMLLFLPAIIFFLTKKDLDDFTFLALADIFLRLSPLADLTLYVFMRKGIIDKLLSSVCCCRMDSDDTNSSSV